MKKLIMSFIILAVALTISAKEYAWRCAIEWTEEKPEWVFVYEDVKLQSDGLYRIFVKWEFPNNSEQSVAKQTWLLSADFDQMIVVSTVGYNSNGEVVYKQSNPHGDWTYILPDTYAMSIVETTKEILLK